MLAVAQMLLSARWKESSTDVAPHTLAELLECLRIWQACATVRVFFVTADEAFPALLYCLTPPQAPKLPSAPTTPYRPSPAAAMRMQHALDAEPATQMYSTPGDLPLGSEASTASQVDTTLSNVASADRALSETASLAALTLDSSAAQSSAQRSAENAQAQVASLRCALAQQAAVLAFVLLQDTFPTAPGALAWLHGLPADMDERPCAAMVSAGCMQQLAAALPACVATLAGYHVWAESDVPVPWAAEDAYAAQYERAARDAAVRNCEVRGMCLMLGLAIDQLQVLVYAGQPSLPLQGVHNAYCSEVLLTVSAALSVSHF